MVNIGEIYKQGNSYFCPVSVLCSDGISKEKYAICYEVKLEQCVVRGGTSLYKKYGRPFVLSLDELALNQQVRFQCVHCLYRNTINSLDQDYQSCKCIQHLLDLPYRYAQFVPECDLFRPSTRPYIKRSLDVDKASTLIKRILNGCSLTELEITKNSLGIEPSFACCGGVLTDKLFTEIFKGFPDDEVTIIPAYWTYFDDNSFNLEAYTISKTDFDYSFYLYDCTIPKIAFVFQKSKTAVLCHYENIYVLTMG